MGVGVVLWVSVLCALGVCAVGERHSLYYMYSTLSKDLDLPGIYEFTALGLLDDREIDYYNSKEQKMIPKQSWMMEKMQEDYWEKGTQSRKSKEQWFKVSLDTIMQQMNHSNQDLHVLQWRHGCEIDESNGKVTFLKGIDQYSYDGSDFLSFDNSHRVWIASVQAAEETKRKWDNVAILNRTSRYLEKECVDWLTKFRAYRKESLRKHSPPKVYAFAKKSVRDLSKLTLTYLATGFYHRDVVMSVRKSRTSFPDHLITSSGVRPNGDGTYQLRKSVEIQEDDKAQFDCCVKHSSLKEPIVVHWDKTNCNIMKLKNAADFSTAGSIAGVLLIIAIIIIVVYFLKKIISGGGGPCFREHKEASSGCEMKNFTANGANGSPVLNSNGESNRAT